MCNPVPLYHCFGMVLGCLQIPCHGATMVFPSQAFDAGLALQAVQAERSVYTWTLSLRGQFLIERSVSH